MTIYVDLAKDIWNPLSFCDKIIPSTYAWKALKMVHRLWWIKTRKQKLVEEKDKVALALKVFFQGFILKNSFATSAAQFILIIVKIEETFTAFSEAQNAWIAIGYTWRGDYHSGKTSLHKRIIPTAKKVYEYFSASFCLVMTFVDVIDAIMFSKKTTCEATLLVKNNLVKIQQYCRQKPEDVQRKLYSNKALIDLIVKKTNQKKSADDLINAIVGSVKSYTELGDITVKYTGPINGILDWISVYTRAIIHGLIRDPSDEARLAYSNRFYDLEEQMVRTHSLIEIFTPFSRMLRRVSDVL